ncbi:hypothetical protein NKI51_10765 [Mesorhizobium australicum]|uniref:hypothetical protein n=1 Tax=Mesorhizobium australicum TaxID=536018 RepID=UPI0033386D37
MTADQLYREAEEVTAQVGEDRRSVWFVAWLMGMPFVSLLPLSWTISPHSFLDDEWLAIAPTIDWFDVGGHRIPAAARARR